MIVKEFYLTRKDGVNLYRTYSDKELMLNKVDTDEVYDEAIDVENAPFTYQETNKTVNEEEQKAMTTDIA